MANLISWIAGNGQGIQEVDEVVWEKAWRVYSKLESYADAALVSAFRCIAWHIKACTVGGNIVLTKQNLKNIMGECVIEWSWNQKLRGFACFIVGIVHEKLQAQLCQGKRNIV